MKYPMMFVAWFDCTVFESWQCFNELFCLPYVYILLLQEECTVKVTSEHLNEIWETGYTDGCVGGKYHYLILSLFPLQPHTGPKLTLCCKMYIQRVIVFTFYKYLYMQTNDWN